MPCSQFHGYALAEEQLLNEAASGKKYYWHHTNASISADSTQLLQNVPAV
jgi:hypothetical protein